MSEANTERLAEVVRKSITEWFRDPAVMAEFEKWKENRDGKHV